MNLQLIDRMAEDAGFTGYDGDGGNTYTGFGDDLVDFGGQAVDFATELKTDRIFQMTVTNAHATNNILMLLNPSYLPSAPTQVVLDGTFSTSLTATGTPATIATWLGWIANNPTTILALKVVSNNSVQLAQNIVFYRRSPFKSLETEQISLQSFTSEYANNDKMVTIRRPFQLDNQTEMQIVAVGNSVTTYTFYCGSVLNTAKALNSKRVKASKHPAVQAANLALTASK